MSLTAAAAMMVAVVGGAARVEIFLLPSSGSLRTTMLRTRFQIR
jgi:hypothetical protein